MSNPNLTGESRSRRKARPYVLMAVGLVLLIAIVVAIAQPRETRDGATSPVVGGDPGVATAPPPSRPPTTGRGTQEMPDLGPASGTPPGAAPQPQR